MDITKLIPKNKFDMDKIDELIRIGYPAYKPILYELLEWIQDINWPVALPLAPLLLEAKEDLIPHVIKIFDSDDDVWKYWVLFILQDMDTEVIKKIEPHIRRLADQPSDSEKKEEVDILAKELLEKV